MAGNRVIFRLGFIGFDRNVYPFGVETEHLYAVDDGNDSAATADVLFGLLQ